MDICLGTHPGRRLSVLSLIVLAGCGQYDPSLPITLVPSDEFSAAEIQVLRESAESWNTEVGTRLRVDPAGDGDQTVWVNYSELACAYASGITEILFDRNVHFCTHLKDGNPVFRHVALHELGHVLGINEHASDPVAIMSLYDSRYTDFRPEDREMFQEANPDFEPLAGEGMSQVVASSIHRPALVKVKGQGSFLLHSDTDKIRFTRVEHGTGRAASPAGTIPSSGEPTWLRAYPRPGGLYITWLADGKRLNLAALDLPSGKVSSKTEVSGQGLPGHLSGLKDLSTAVVRDNLYVAIYGLKNGYYMRVLRFDRATGKALPFAIGRADYTRGLLATPVGGGAAPGDR